MPMPTQFGYVDTPAGQLHYAEAGSGPPVLLLHQTPRSTDEYREVIELLAPHVHAIALDTVGMGRSAPLVGEHSIERYAEAAGWFCDGHGLRDESGLTVVGHHTGGVIALELCAQRPALVSKLVLSSTPWVDAASRERRRSRPPIDHVDVQADGSHLAQLWQRRQAFYPANRPDLLHRFVRDAMVVEDPEAGHLAVGRYHMEDRVDLIKCPTLCIAHRDDPYSFAEHDELVQRIDGAQLTIIEGGMVPLEYTAAYFADAVLRFVAPLI
jgi:pimeloyl-ACP methyl ester carboxylesterase